MSDISKRLDRLIRKEKTILPVKTEQGILVGDVLILTVDSTKDLIRDGNVMYANIYLNGITIEIANILARRGNLVRADILYRADQEYGRYFEDSQLLRSRYQRAVDVQDYDRADVLYARYCESRDKALLAKDKALGLIK